jgi:hypothetical protein
MIGINYASDNMTKSQLVCMESSKQHGCNEFYCYGESDITFAFGWFNREIINQERGAGYWLWKPYILYSKMLESEENEIIVYLDSGVEVINSLNYIKDRMGDNIDIWLFGNEHNHSDWCKGEVLRDMRVDYVIYKTNPKQAQASVIFVRNTQFARNFVKEWLLWCQMPNFINDSPSVSDNSPNFKEHRHDQAILTNLAIKYGIPLHWWPTQYGHFIKHNYHGDNYPQLFNHHRKRNNEW